MLSTANSAGLVPDADAHPALIGSDIIDAVGRHLAEFRIDEIMDAHLLGIAHWPPFPTAVLEVPD